MIITLDPTLEPLENNYRYHRSARHVTSRTIPPNEYSGNLFEGTIPSSSEKTIAYSFDGKEHDLYHINYTEYLCQCYTEHRSIVLTPDILWHTVLAEIATVIKNNPEPHRSLFTSVVGLTIVCVEIPSPKAKALG